MQHEVLVGMHGWEEDVQPEHVIGIDISAWARLSGKRRLLDWNLCTRAVATLAQLQEWGVASGEPLMLDQEAEKLKAIGLNCNAEIALFT